MISKGKFTSFEPVGLSRADASHRQVRGRIETRAGCGSGKPTDKIIAEYADMGAFICFYPGLTKK